MLRHFLFRIAALAAILTFGMSGRLSADGFPLPLQNAGTWGKSPAGLVTDIQKALQNSGFLDAVAVAGNIANGLAQGKVPAIDDLAHTIEGHVQTQVAASVQQATQATQLLSRLDVGALQQLFSTLQSTITTPEEFAFSIPGGRLVFRRNLLDVSLCAVIAGPGGARVTLGLSNGEHLGGNPAERFINPTREAVLFTDLALGYSNLQVRRRLLAPPVAGPDPSISIQAATYFKIHDDWVQLRFAGSDPEALTLTLQFVVGVKAGVSAEIQAEVEGQVILAVVVNPTQVTSLLLDITDILKDGLGSASPASLEAAPAVVAPVLKEVFAYLQSVQDNGQELGEVSVSFAVDGGIGVGIWDTGINAASVGAQLSISVPLEALVSLRGETLAAELEAGLQIATQMGSLFEAMSEGRLNATEMARQRDLIGLSARKLALSLVNGFVSHIKDVQLSSQLGLYAAGDIGQVADQTIPLLVVTFDIPVGQILVDGVNGIPKFVDGVTESAKAVAWLAESAISAGLNGAESLSLGRIVTPPSNPINFVQRPRGNPPTPPTAADWEAMAADLLDDVTYSIQCGPISLEGVSLGHYVRLAGGAGEVATSLLTGAIRSAVNFDDKPLLDALRAAPAQVANEAKDLLIFNLKNLSLSFRPNIGASGTVGAEVTLGVGASIGFDARFKTSLILLAIGDGNYDEPDGTLLAGFDIPMELSASAGVSLGEAVEFTAEGGVTVGMSLANLTLKDWGRDLPAPAGLSIAGFELIDFAGTNRQDGTISGKGWIVLPMGGLVRADHFKVDAAGKVLEGAWSGVLELGPFGEVTVAGGTITDNGLFGTADLAVGLSTLKADFRLLSNGLLFGHAVGSLNLGGVPLANVDVSLQEDGSFAGTARAQIAGATSESRIRLQVLNQPSASLSSVTVLGGASARLDLKLNNTGATGTATADVFGQPVGFNVALVPGSGLTGSTVARLSTPWGLAIDSNLQIDGTGIHGSGKTRILGSDFTASNLRLQPNGRLTGSFSGSLSADNQLLALQSLEILGDRLQGRTTVNVAGIQAAEVLLTVDQNGIIGRFAGGLPLFGAGSATAWLRLTDRIEVFGDLDAGFLGTLESQLRGQLLTGLSAAEETLRREREKLTANTADRDRLNEELVTLRQQILSEQATVRAAAESALADAQAALKKANEDLDKAIAALAAASGDLSTQFANASNAFRSASTALSTAQGEVDKINRAIGDLDRWYNSQNAIAKAFLWAGYQASRAALVVSLNVANGTLAAARQAYNTANSSLQLIQQQLANAQSLLSDKTLKEQLVAAAEGKADEARRNLDAIIAIGADPRLDPRHVAVTLARDAVQLLMDASAAIIQQTTAALGDVAGLIDLIRQQGEASLVQISRISFRSLLTELNQGFTQLNIDARVANQPRRFLINYDLRSGQNGDNLAQAARQLSPSLYPAIAWTVLPWTDDGTSGISPGHTLWAYHFNSTGSATVASVPVPGVPGNAPAVAGRFSVAGFPNTYTGDQNELTAGNGGSAVMAANFLWGENPGTVTFEGLTPGQSYRATFLSVGWDDPPLLRNVTFLNGTNSLSVSQNLYGNNRGLRVDHTFTAAAATHVVTLTPAAVDTYHLYALALSVDGDFTTTLADWKQSEFGADAFNPAVSGDDADPDGDQIPNLLEYSLRTSPTAFNAPAFALPVPVSLPDSGEARQFTFPYQAGSADIIYRLRHSTDLRNWDDIFRLNLVTGEITQAPGVSGTLDTANQTVTVTVTDRRLFDGSSFWRLTVERP